MTAVYQVVTIVTFAYDLALLISKLHPLVVLSYYNHNNYFLSAAKENDKDCQTFFVRLCVYMYMYMYIHACTHKYMYMYMYTCDVHLL